MILPIHHDRSTLGVEARSRWKKKRFLVAGGVLASMALTGCLGATEGRSPAASASFPSVSASPTAAVSTAPATPSPTPPPSPSPTPTPALEPAGATEPPAGSDQEQLAPAEPIRRASAAQKPVRKEMPPKEKARKEAPPAEHRPRAASGSRPAPSAKRSVREAPAPAQRKGWYKNCSEARAAGVTPIRRGQPGYSSKLDRDNDGVACE